MSRVPAGIMAGKGTLENNSSESRYTQAAADFVATDDFPVEFVCPITQTLMQDPVLTIQGNVYEHAAITEWLQSHTTDPLTNNHLTAFTLIPCNPIKSEIEEFRAAVRRLGPEAAARLPMPQQPQPVLLSDPMPASKPTTETAAPSSAVTPHARQHAAAPHSLAHPVAFTPFPQPLTTFSQALSAVLHSSLQIASYQSVIAKQTSARTSSCQQEVYRAVLLQQEGCPALQPSHAQARDSVSRCHSQLKLAETHVDSGSQPIQEAALQCTVHRQ